MTMMESDLFEAAAHLSSPRFKAYVGYIRVSSKRQAVDGDSFDVQRDELAAYAGEHGAVLHGPHQDDLSGYRNNVKHRPGLRAAIDEALRLQVPLLGARVDRLTRRLEDLSLLDVDGLILVAADRGVVDRATLKAAVAKANAESEAKSRRAKDQHAKRRRGSGWVAPPGFDYGRMKGALKNKLRADLRVQEVADFIRTNPDARRLSHEKRARRLNDAGVLNLKGIRGLRDPWTREALRPVWKAAEAILGQRDAKAPEAASVAASASPCVSIPLVEADGSTANSEGLPRAEIFRRALEEDCSVPRALNEFERQALIISLRANVKGASPLPKATIDLLLMILKQPERRLTAKNLGQIRGFIRRNA